MDGDDDSNQDAPSRAARTRFAAQRDFASASARLGGRDFFHYPGGGYRKPLEAKILKGLGVIPGLPDLWVIWRGRVHCIELKSERGRLTETQVDMLNRLNRAGVAVATAHSLDEALKYLTDWGLLKGSVQ
jgi:hypothetical protein